MRERVYALRLSEVESARLERLADHYGLNVAGVLRLLVKRAVDALGLEPSAKQKKRGGRAAR